MTDRDKLIAAFIQTKGVTKCPTAVVAPTSNPTVTPADVEALERHRIEQEEGGRRHWYKQRVKGAVAGAMAAASVQRVRRLAEGSHYGD